MSDKKILQYKKNLTKQKKLVYTEYTIVKDKRKTKNNTVPITFNVEYLTQDINHRGMNFD